MSRPDQSSHRRADILESGFELVRAETQTDFGGVAIGQKFQDDGFPVIGNPSTVKALDRKFPHVCSPLSSPGGAYAEPTWLGDYIGIPFASRGDTRDGCHCWGLVRLVYREQLGLDLPAYGALSASDVLAAARALSRGKVQPPWREADRPLRMFDGVVMTRRSHKLRAVDGHVGVMVTSRLMLHVEQDCDAVKIAIDHPSVKDCIIGFVRHEALA